MFFRIVKITSVLQAAVLIILCAGLCKPVISNYYYDNAAAYPDYQDYVGAREVGGYSEESDDYYPIDYFEDNDYSSSYHPSVQGRSEIVHDGPEAGCGFDTFRYFKDYMNCGMYHKCDLQNGTWNRTTFNCSDKKSYDEEKQNCDSSSLCPISYPEIPDNLKCTKDYQKIPNPSDCHKYYVCHDTGPYFTVESKNCSKVSLITPGKIIEYFFDEKLQGCFPVSYSQNICPQLITDIPDGWSCPANGTFNPSPKNCSEYYSCTRNGSQIITRSCSKPGEVFNKNGTDPVCIKGTCLMKVPEGLECDALDVNQPVKTDCQKYYMCFKCNDTSEPEAKCYNGIMTCENGMYFDEITRNCTKSPKCPKDLEVLPEGEKGKCTKDGDMNVDPDHCSKYYTCITCSKPGGWCLDPMDCPVGSFFDDFAKKCVYTGRCPQKFDELPPGWTCMNQSDTYAVPGKCSEFYECFRCNKPREWCILTNSCPSGAYFDEAQRNCTDSPVCPQDLMVKPEGLVCNGYDDGSAMPLNCTSYYSCYSCGRPMTGECIVSYTCPSGQIFDLLALKCVTGRCAGWPEILPEGWKCTKEGMKHATPMDCSRYYTCIRCPDSDNNPWCYEKHECEGNEVYDDSMQGCVAGPYCPQDLTEIGEGPEWGCAAEGDRNVVPDDCSKWYECLSCNRPRKYCYKDQISCPLGSHFDQHMKNCTFGSCPQTRPELPDGWACQHDKDEQVVPNDCSSHFTCHLCSKPKGWCIEQEPCPANQTFDNLQKSCVAGRCPQLDPMLPPGWTCKQEGERNVVPDDCSMFYVCKTCEEDGEDGWCYKGLEMCPDGQTFNSVTKTCTSGRCPQYPPILPENYKCSIIGEKHVHPLDCSSFYICAMCPDAAENVGATWCYTLHKCKNGHTFDEANGLCVKDDKCRQAPPVLPPGWNCTGHEELHVHPEDCTKYYTCLIFQNEKAYVEESCPSDHYFDDTSKVCVMTTQCPQDPQQLPPGWICDKDGDKHQHPDDCSKYYTCSQVNISKPVRRSNARAGWKPGMEYADLSNPNPYKDYEPTEEPEPPMVMKTKKPKNRTKTTTPSTVNQNEETTTPDSSQDTTKPPETPLPVTKPPETPPPVTKPPETPPPVTKSPETPLPVSSQNTTKPPEPPVEYKEISYMSVSISSCAPGENFNEAAASCQAGPCPQNLPPLPPGWICVNDGELMVHPLDCGYYFKCIKNQNTWTYELKKCPEGSNFDQRNKYCKKGSCPQMYPKLPEGWKCEGDGIKQVHPTDCTQYYTCVLCIGGTITGKSFSPRSLLGGMPNALGGIESVIQSRSNVIGGPLPGGGLGLGCGEGVGWCYKDVGKCKPGYTFDNKGKQCVTTAPKPPPTEECLDNECITPIPKMSGRTIASQGVLCKYNNERVANPTNCREYYVCLIVGNKKTTILMSCQKGHYFEPKWKRCVLGDCEQYVSGRSEYGYASGRNVELGSSYENYDNNYFNYY